MTKTRRKIIASVVLFTFIATVLIGGSSLYYMKREFKQNTLDLLVESAQVYGKDTDRIITGVESMVDTLTKSIIGVIDPARIHERSYYYSLTKEIDQIALQFHDNTLNIMSIYVRFDPEIAYSTSGFFHSDSNGDGHLERLVPTDLSLYESSDREHVGWFYEPLTSGHPVWLDPYYNANIDIDMISYVAPLIIGDTTIGVVGVDINFDSFKEIVAQSPEIGNAVLLNEDFAFLIHDQFTLEDHIRDIDGGNLAYIESEMRQNPTGIVHYELFNEDKILGYSQLENQWIMVIMLTEKEAFSRVNRAFNAIVLIIGLMIVVLLWLSYNLGGFIDHLVTKNTELEEVVTKRTAELNRSNQELKEAMLELEDSQEELIALNSELKDSYNQLQSAQNQLIIAEKLASLGELVAGVAHEINTPLGIGLTLSSFLNDTIRQIDGRYKSGNLTKAELTECIHSTKEASDLAVKNLMRAAEIVNTFKQVAVDQSTLEMRKINLSTYTEKIIHNLTPRLSKEKHHYRIHAPINLEIYTFPGPIAQIITNLFINTLIHAFKDNRNGQIDITLEKTTSHIYLIYEDNGCGIPEEMVNKIFDPFFSTNRHNGSSGLGLHITHNLVTQTLEGTIDVTSTVGVGTRFDIYFPYIEQGPKEN
jgi:signal transduction histidine kinase